MGTEAARNKSGPSRAMHSFTPKALAATVRQTGSCRATRTSTADILSDNAGFVITGQCTRVSHRPGSSLQAAAGRRLWHRHVQAPGQFGPSGHLHKAHVTVLQPRCINKGSDVQGTDSISNPIPESINIMVSCEVSASTRALEQDVFKSPFPPKFSCGAQDQM